MNARSTFDLTIQEEPMLTAKDMLARQLRRARRQVEETRKYLAEQEERLARLGP